MARSIMSRIADHLDQFVESSPEPLVFTTPAGGALHRGTFGRQVWRPAVVAAGLEGFTFHGLRHSFVSVLVAAGCNVREVSEWAGHNSLGLHFHLLRAGCFRTDRTLRWTAWTPCWAEVVRPVCVSNHLTAKAEAAPTG